MKKILAIPFVIVLFVIFCAFSASADIGPRPSASFHLTYSGEEIADAEFNAAMLVCQKDKGYAGETIPELKIELYDGERVCYWQPNPFAYGGDCRESSCIFRHLGADEFMLAAYIPSIDKVFMSSAVKMENYYSSYEAKILPGGTIAIEETTGFFRRAASHDLFGFFIALILTLALELATAFIFILKTKLSKNILKAVALGNIISLPAVWFVFPLISKSLSGSPLGLVRVIVVAEILAFLFEGWLIHFMNKKVISLKKSFVLSLIMNLISLIIGGILFIVLAFVIGF